MPRRTRAGCVLALLALAAPSLASATWCVHPVSPCGSSARAPVSAPAGPSVGAARTRAHDVRKRHAHHVRSGWHQYLSSGTCTPCPANAGTGPDEPVGEADISGTCPRATTGRSTADTFCVGSLVSLHVQCRVPGHNFVVCKHVHQVRAGKVQGRLGRTTVCGL
jgi:hypothetical protein